MAWPIDSGRNGCACALQSRCGRRSPACVGPTRFRFRRPEPWCKASSSSNDLRFVGIGEREFELAAQAYAEFGKGRHQAALNMGDCFAYACAKANRARLLFKGDDFSKTDIAPA